MEEKKWNPNNLLWDGSVYNMRASEPASHVSQHASHASQQASHASQHEITFF